MGSGCKFCIGGMNVGCVCVDVSKSKSMIAVRPADSLACHLKEVTGNMASPKAVKGA